MTTAAQIAEAARWVSDARRIVALTGAGISTQSVFRIPVAHGDCGR